jgi:hypothetical protein
LAKIWFELMDTSMEASHELALTRPARRALIVGIQDFFKMHVEGFSGLQSHEVLEEVLG